MTQDEEIKAGNQAMIDVFDVLSTNFRLHTPPRELGTGAYVAYALEILANVIAHMFDTLYVIDSTSENRKNIRHVYKHFLTGLEARIENSIKGDGK